MFRFLAVPAVLLAIAPAIAAQADDLLAEARTALDEKNVVKAMDLLSQALEADPAHARSAYERGHLLLMIGEPENAIADFTTAILGDPSFGRAYAARAEAKLVLKEGESAIADFDRAIAVSPGDFEVHVSRATFRLKIGNISGAKSDLENAKALANAATAARIGAILERLR
jgi:tetratricopeptide (TPR) repeat protein